MNLRNNNSLFFFFFVKDDDDQIADMAGDEDEGSYNDSD